MTIDAPKKKGLEQLHNGRKVSAQQLAHLFQSSVLRTCLSPHTCTFPLLQSPIGTLQLSPDTLLPLTSREPLSRTNVPMLQTPSWLTSTQVQLLRAPGPHKEGRRLLGSLIVLQSSIPTPALTGVTPIGLLPLHLQPWAGHRT